MACKEDRFTLGDRVYLIRQMPPRLAIPVEVYLAKTIGEPLFKAFAENGLKSDGAFSVAIGLFAERLDDVGLLRSMQSVFRYVGIMDKVVRICVEGDAGAGIDEWFSGRNKEIWEVFVKALEVNFADFFGGSFSLSSLVGKLSPGPQPNLQTSTSISGDPVSQTQSSATPSVP